MDNLAIAWRPQEETPPEEAQRKDAHEVVKGTGVNFLGNLGKISRFGYYIIVTRFLGAEVLGLFSLGWHLIDMVSKFGLFGLDRAVIRYVSRFRTDGDAEGAHRTIGQALLFGLVASLIVTGTVWILAPLAGVFARWGSGSVFGHPDFVQILRLLALCIPFYVLSSILLAALKGLRIMKFDIFVKGLSEPFVMLSTTIVLCLLGWTVPGLAFAYVLASVCGLALAIRFFCSRFSLPRTLTWTRRLSESSRLVKFSAPIPIYDAFYSLMSRIDLFIIALFLPAASVGIYAATTEVAGIVKKIRQSVDPIFAPITSGLLHQDRKERVSLLFASVTRWILILEMAFLLVFGLWGSSILSIFGPAFSAGFWALILLAFGHTINGAFGSAEMILLMSGRSGINLLNTSLLVVVNLGLNLLLIPKYGITGAALAAAISLKLVNLLRIIEVRFLLGVHPFRWSLLKPISAACLAFAVGASLLQIDSSWSYFSAISLPLYFGLLKAFGLEAGDREILQKIYNKIPVLRRWAQVWDLAGLKGRKTLQQPPFSSPPSPTSSDQTHIAAD